jgi:uncharacterized membrane protein
VSRLDRLRERFWFIPAVLCTAAAGAAWLLIQIDEARDGDPIPSILDWLVYEVGESGSRDILVAIATSSLAVAGTTFSITMAVLALTSSSYGPRLVRNFMADRGNQLVLGVYVATFLYSLLVLRSIRALGDPGDPEAEVFVPHLAVNAAVLLAVLNVVVLIYFIHHISSSIQISAIASRVRDDLHRTIDRLYPDEIGHDIGDIGDVDTEPPEPPADDDFDGEPVCADRTGYVQHVRESALLELARARDVVIALRVRPGSHVIDEQELAVIAPADRLDDALAGSLRDAVVVSRSRSPYQDVEFAVQQLTELAVRALSPGTNDPYTAENALDDLASGLALLAERAVPSAERFDDDGRLRVHAPAVDVSELVSQVMNAMRWYAIGHPGVVLAALELVERVGERAARRRVRARLLAEVDRLATAVDRAGWQDHDVEVFHARADEVARGLART